MIPYKEVESGKYPGAHVFPPIKGLNNKRPVTGLDFASLYPSIIMTYNFSPEKIILEEKETNILQQKKIRLHKIEFLFNGRVLQAWSVLHENKTNKKGLYPLVLEKLLDKRNKMKSDLAILAKKKEHMELVIGKIKEKSLSLMDSIDYILKNKKEKEIHADMAGTLIPFINETYEIFIIEYNSICSDYTYLDSKQKAVKIYMNTFYGEAGNSLSPFFLRHLAGGITSMSQFNIKLVAEYVLKKGYGIQYGDTDSLYLTCPEDNYKKCDLAYRNNSISTLEYWTEMVNITMKVMEKLRNEVNTYLKIKSRSTYLKMAYEEVLFPVVFTGKKKYFGIPQEKKVNFKPKKLFIKGIDTVKQGQSKLFITIGERIMWKAMEVKDNQSLHKIVEDVLRDAVTNSKQWEFDQFIQTDTWKPNVQNLTVQWFIERMRKTYKDKIPEPGDRFSYVIPKTNIDFDLSGKKLNLTKGDRIEFVDVAKELKKDIDLSYYLQNKIIGLCARFINYDNRYQPPLSDKIRQLKDSDEKYKQIDKYSQKKAKK
ncbi:hypothetical protein C2G38_2296199 [Gigaspora rosea]|uniref:DNA-directed DNA polymerase n=1 Tax=Gigaspora rosea TaxID=44941 RepID=A0A397TVE8_9GLOM|nr:hypothetical protein C2G38_2296199 [Gigaspora rosea]